MCGRGRWGEGCGSAAGGGFERAQHGGADGDDAAAAGAGAGDGIEALRRDDERFRMHFVVGEVIGFDRGECAETDVESQRGDFDALVGEGGQELWGEMEAGGGSGDGAGVLGIDGLVVETI